MAYEIFFFDEAIQDIRAAKNWYRIQVKGLDKKFAQDIKIAITRLKDRPAIHAVRYNNIRVCHPDIFPYSIHFYIDEIDMKVVVVSIVHNSRDPLFSQERTSVLNEPEAIYHATLK